jgi:hypothetical protein
MALSVLLSGMFVFFRMNENICRTSESLFLGLANLAESKKTHLTGGVPGAGCYVPISNLAERTPADIQAEFL